VAESLQACGFELRAQIVWAKDALVLGRGHYHWTHEPCWYGVRAGGNGHWHGDRSQTTLWEISGRKQDATKQTTLWPIAGRGQDAETALASKSGRPLNKGDVYKLLNNWTHVGEVAHKGQVYPGEHQAIVPRELSAR
jgi:N6-adenosine-specific RNA methylase IME4